MSVYYDDLRKKKIIEDKKAVPTVEVALTFGGLNLSSAKRYAKVARVGGSCTLLGAAQRGKNTTILASVMSKWMGSCLAVSKPQSWRSSRPTKVVRFCPQRCGPGRWWCSTTLGHTRASVCDS